MIGRIAIAVAVVSAIAAPAAAQMEAALGKPLEVPNLPAGTITVRVVDGSIEKPVSGLDVTVEAADGVKLVARTSGEGRARIAGLKPGVEYVAKVTVGKETLETERFAMPAQGGLAFMLSAKPLSQVGGPAADGHGGGGGEDELPPIMREPRRISGQARPEQKDPAGQLTVRLVQGKFKQTDAGIVSEFPPGATVQLVAYTASGKITVQDKKVDDEGRAIFGGLGQNDAYYAIALLPRAGGVVDRLVSQAIQMPPMVGMRVILAGHAADSPEPPIDDTLAFADRQTPEQPGRIVVQVDATADQSSLLASVKEVELYQVGKAEAIARRPVEAYQPTAADIIGRAGQLPAQSNQGLQDGQVSLLVIRMSKRQGLEGISIQVRPEPADPQASPVTLTTDARGFVVAGNLTKGKAYVATATVHGKAIDSEPFTVPETGALSLAFAVDWPNEGVKQARFEGLASQPGAVYYARVAAGKRELLSPPLPLTPQLGGAAALVFYPEVMFAFHGGGDVDDEKVWFEMRMSIANTGQRPVDTGKEGLLLPLPKGFIGASVNEEMATRVKVDPDRGVVWTGTLPPGQQDFDLTFALPVESGVVEFDMALPYGLRGGSLMLGEHPGVTFEGIPTSAEVERRDVRGKPCEKGQSERCFNVFRDISIAPNQRLVFQIAGLPQPPAWKGWVRVGVGITVLMLLAWGMWGIYAARRLPPLVAATAAVADKTGRGRKKQRDLERRREKLLDDLVKLETLKRAGKVADAEYEATRDRTVSLLEKLYSELRDPG